MSLHLPPPPRPPRSPWQRLYAAALARRAHRLDASATRLPVPVVSVGNLHWGGGGKTPVTLALAKWLRDRGEPVAILSRGYRRSTRGPLVVSRGHGHGPEVPVTAAGDEPFAMARALPDVGVVVASARAEAGRLALAALDPAPRLLLLDDGFSHRALRRDLDLVCLPLDDPWGRGRLLPTGWLREPLAAAARADVALLTGVAESDVAAAEADGSGAELARGLAAHGFRGPGFASVTRTLPPRLVGGPPLAAGARVLAVAAIARPAPFFAAVGAAGLELAGEASFRDHHDYPERELEALERRARAAGAVALVTTEKDRAKLEGRLSLPLAVLPVEARPEPRFWEWFEARLGELPG